MTKGVYTFLILAAAIFIFVSVFLYSFLVYAGDTSTFEANIIGDQGSADLVSIQVPDYLFFGNVSKSEASEELQVYVNNTGSVAINVRPILVDSTDPYFKYLYFRSHKTHNGTAVPFDQIGDFYFNMSKPGTSGYSDEYFYVKLDLTDYQGEIDQDYIGHKVNVRFVAVAQ